MAKLCIQSFATVGLLACLSAGHQTACKVGDTYHAVADPQQRWPVANPGLVAPVQVNYSFPSIAFPLEGEFTGESIALAIPSSYTGGVVVYSPSNNSFAVESYQLTRIEVRKAGQEPEGVNQVLSHALEAVLILQQVAGNYWSIVVVPLVVSTEATHDPLFSLVTGANMPTKAGQKEAMVVSSAQELEPSDFFGNKTLLNYWAKLPTNCAGYEADARKFMRTEPLNVGYETYKKLLETLTHAPDAPPLNQEQVAWEVNTCSIDGVCTGVKVVDLAAELSSALQTQSQATLELRERKALMDDAYEDLVNGSANSSGSGAANITTNLEMAVSARSDLQTAQQEFDSAVEYAAQVEEWYNRSGRVSFDAGLPEPKSAIVQSLNSDSSSANSGSSTSSSSTSSSSTSSSGTSSSSTSGSSTLGSTTSGSSASGSNAQGSSTSESNVSGSSTSGGTTSENATSASNTSASNTSVLTQVEGRTVRYLEEPWARGPLIRQANPVELRSTIPRSSETLGHRSDCSGLRMSPISINSAHAVDPGSISLALREPLKFVLGASTTSQAVSTAAANGRMRILPRQSDAFGAVVLRGLVQPISYIDLVVPGDHSIDGFVGDAEVQLVHLPPQAGPAVAVALRLQMGDVENKWISGLFQQGRLRASSALVGQPIAELHDGLQHGSLDRYFRYDGTLTSAPCSSAKWFVVDAPGVISKWQLYTLLQRVGGVDRDGRLVTSVVSPRQRFHASLVAVGTTELTSQGAANLPSERLTSDGTQTQISIGGVRKRRIDV